MKKLIIQKIGLIVFLFAALPSFLLAQNIDKSYDGVKEIEVNIAMGNLDIIKGTSDKVLVEGEYDEYIVEVRISNRNGHLKIEEKSLRNNNNNNNSKKSRWILTIPDGLEIEANVGMGDFDLEGVKVGEIDGNIGMGDCELKDTEGDIRLNTGMGNIRITDSKGDFDLNSGMNDIKIKNSEGKFKANSGMGNIILRGVKATGDVSLNSGMGNVRLELDGKLMADVSINTGMGDATLDFNGNKINGEFEMKCGIQGGKIIAPFDFDTVNKVGGKRSGHIKKAARIGDTDNYIQISTGTGKAEVKS